MSPQTNIGTSVGSVITSISDCEYWSLTSGVTPAPVVFVSLDYNEPCTKQTTISSDYRVASWDGSQWVNRGGIINGSTVKTFSTVTGSGLFTLAAKVDEVTFNYCNQNLSLPTGLLEASDNNNGHGSYLFEFSQDNFTTIISYIVPQGQKPSLNDVPGLLYDNTYSVRISFSDDGETYSLPGSVCQFTILPCAQNTITVSISIANCGVVTAGASGGISPYSYAWSDGQTTSTVNLNAGSSSVLTVTDSKNCKADGSAAIPFCQSNSTIQINAAPSQGCAPLTSTFTSTINPAFPSAAGNITTITVPPVVNFLQNIFLPCGHFYEITITGWQSFNSHPGNQFFDGEFRYDNNNGAWTPTNINRFGTDYPIDDITPDGDQQANPDYAVPRTYTYYIVGRGNNLVIRNTDNGGNYADNVGPGMTYTIREVPASFFSPAASYQYEHVLSINGIIKLTQTNSSMNYLNTLSTPGLNTYTLNLTNSVLTTDKGQCKFSQSKDITVFPALVITSQVSNPLCTGQYGSIDITVINGTGAYSYLWDDGAMTEDRTNLQAGTYTVTATDSNGCSVSKIFTINAAPPELILTTQAVSQPVCIGDFGSASVNAAGGTEPYTYLWSNGIIGSTGADLIPGTYSVTVTDGHGCISTLSDITIIEPQYTYGITVAPQNADQNLTVYYNSGNGFPNTTDVPNSIGLQAYHNSPDAVFSWSNGAATKDIIVNYYDIAPDESKTFTVTITANGCTVSESIIISAIDVNSGIEDANWTTPVAQNRSNCNNALDLDYNVSFLRGLEITNNEGWLKLSTAQSDINLCIVPGGTDFRITNVTLYSGSCNNLQLLKSFQDPVTDVYKIDLQLKNIPLNQELILKITTANTSEEPPVNKQISNLIDLISSNREVIPIKAQDPNYCLDFDGLNDYISLPTINLTDNEQFSVEAMVWPENITTNRYYEIIRQNSFTGTDYLLSFQENGTKLSFGINTELAYEELDVNMPASTFISGWHHIAATINQQKMCLYVDGALVGEKNTTGKIKMDPVIHRIGASGNKEFFNGKIDEIRLWSIALTPTQINEGKNCSFRTQQTHLIASYTFQDIPFPNGVITDFSDFNYDAAFPFEPLHKPFLAYGSLSVNACSICNTCDYCETSPVTAPLINLQPIKPGWALIFQDEFEGTSLNNHWRKRNGDGGPYISNPFYYFKDYPENIEVSNHTLKLRTVSMPGLYENETDSTWNTYPYTSGWITCDDLIFGPGHYYEIRCKIPKGKLHHPGFWTYTCSPNWSEVDIYENGFGDEEHLRKLGTNSHNGFNLCKYNNEVSTSGCDIPISTDLPDLASDWYTVGCDWTNAEIKWYINNSLVRVQTENVPQHPGDLNLNTTLSYWGTDFGSEYIKAINDFNAMNDAGNFPGTFEVDYVRVYEKKCEMIEAVSDYSVEQGFNNNEERPRLLGDVDGDGNDDVVAFGWNYTQVSLSNGDGTFSSPQYVSQNFTKEQGYTSNNTRPRFLADINKDGKSDMIGFGTNNVYVALSTSKDGVASFETPVNVINDFTVEQGWENQITRPRMLTDVNRDGKPDIVGFGYNNTFVSLNTTIPNGSTPSFKTVPDDVLQSYTVEQGWTNMDIMPRMFADVNGDGRPDIVGFGAGSTYVSLSTSSPTVASFDPPVNIINNFTIGQGFTNQQERPRLIGDINGDGKEDIIAFAWNHTLVCLSTSKGNNVSFKQQIDYVLDNFTQEQGWTTLNQFPRIIKDINWDGFDDIIGFGGGEVKIAMNRSSPIIPAFDELQNIMDDFCNAQGWIDQDQYPRQIAFVNGDCIPDIIGFGHNKVYSFGCLWNSNCGQAEARTSMSNNLMNNIQLADNGSQNHRTKLYPNPNSGRMIIEYDELVENATIIILDASGKTQYSSLLHKGSNSIKIKETNLAPGIYLYRIISDSNENISQSKFIVQ